MRKLAQLTVGFLAALAAPAAWAQGCAMCRNSAAAGGADAARTFDLAILVLLIPTISIFVGILVFAFRRRTRSLDEEELQHFDPVTLLEQPHGSNLGRTDILVCPPASKNAAR
jgi:hypothetical protein